MTREELIRSGLNKWVNAKFRGILNYATGVGKTYAAILAIEKFYNAYPKEKILIVCPTNFVIDNFKKEFKKFNKTTLLKKCNFICYASLHKEDTQYSLIVFDEVHHLVTEKKMQFFKNCKYKALLGLSASLTPEEIVGLKFFMPIIDVFTIQQAVKAGFVAPYTIINIPVELNIGERDTYNELTSKIDFTTVNYGARAWGLINKRANVIHNANQKLKIVESLVELFPENYGIIFNLKKVNADLVAKKLGINCVSIHSGHSQKQIDSKINKFIDGRTRTQIISTVKTLNEGISLPRLEFGIQLSRNSKNRDFIQNLGRLVRKDVENKHAIMIRTYVIDSVEERWVKDSQLGFNVKNVTTYEQLKTAIEQIKHAA